MKLNAKSINYLKISEELAELIKRKVIQSLGTDGDDIIITYINLMEPHTSETVELDVFLNSNKTVPIAIDKAEFIRLQSIDPEKIVFATDKIVDVDLTDELRAILKKELVYALEAELYPGSDYIDFRKCPEIKIMNIILHASDPDKVYFSLDILYFIEGQPEKTSRFDFWLDESDFPLDLCKKRHIGYTDIKELELPHEDIIVLEKIDGSNLGIGFIDDNTIMIQSRKRVLALLSCYCPMENITVREPCREANKRLVKSYDVARVPRSRARDVIAQQKFFDLEFIVNELVSKIIYIRHKLQCNFMVFGELFGSSKHPQKDKKKKAHLLRYHSEESKRLLKSDRVFYSAFDILVDNAKYLRYSDAIDLFKEVELPYTKVLPINYSGNEDVQKIIETFPSQYAEEPLEGVVIKKNAEEPKYHRTITKLKRKAFAETRGKTITVDNFITMNRLANCYKKCGDDDEKVVECFIEDVEEAILESLKSRIVQKATNYANIYLQKIKK